MNGSANITLMGEAGMAEQEVFALLMDPIHPNSFSEINEVHILVSP
jgi:hypothetical protein